MTTNRQLRNGAAALGFSLAALLGGCPRVTSDTSGLPSNNSTEGRTLTLFEGDLQNQLDQTLRTSFTIPYVCDNIVGVNVFTPDQEGRPAPFDATFTGSTNSDGTSTEVGITLRDNQFSYFPGETFDLVIAGISQEPFVRNITHTIKVQYETGISGSTAQQQIDDLRTDLHNHEGQTVPPAHTPGEPNKPAYIIGDGICSPGEPASSPDCALPIKPTISGLEKQITMQLYEGSNQLPDVDYLHPITIQEGTTRSFTARLTMPSELETQMLHDGFSVKTAIIRELGYGPETPDYDLSRELDGIVVGSIQPVARISAGVYETALKLRDNLLSPQSSEEIGAVYTLSDSSGTFTFGDAAYFSESSTESH